MASKTKLIISATIALLFTVAVAFFTEAYLDLERTMIALIGVFILITLLFWLLSILIKFIKHPPLQNKHQHGQPAILVQDEPSSPAFRSGLSDARLPASKKEAEIMAKQWLKQAADSVKIINTTKKASVFFERYDFFIDTLERLAYCEKWVSFRGELPSSKLRGVETVRKEQIRLFILRYAQDTREKMYQLSTQKGKLNKAEAYYNTLTEYSNLIDNDNILLLTEQYELLKQVAQ